MEKVKKIVLLTDNDEQMEIDFQEFRDRLASEITNSIDSVISQFITPGATNAGQKEPWLEAAGQKEAGSGKNLKTRDKILMLIAQDKHVTAKVLAQKVCVTEKAVEKQLANLKADGIIRRQGCNKGGHWLIIKGE